MVYVSSDLYLLFYVACHVISAFVIHFILCILFRFMFSECYTLGFFGLLVFYFCVAYSVCIVLLFI